MTKQELYAKIYLLIRDIYGMCFAYDKGKLDVMYESAKYKLEYLYGYQKEKIQSGKGKEG